ncbi:MAG: GspE/PulE family protein, partial [bacterium]|nr:GspE/PulE family protein [bacterium]
IGFEEKRIKDLARQNQIPYINLQKLAIEADALILIPAEEAKSSQVICFYKSKGTLRIGMGDPHDKKALSIIESLKEKYKPIVYLISEASLEHALSLYPLDLGEERKGEKKAEKIILNQDLIEQAAALISEWPALGNSLINKNTDELINILMSAGIGARASDIHLEPKETEIILRLRIDGIMRDIIAFTPQVYPRILARLKLISGLKLNIKKMPQDGRFTVYYDHADIDVRVSSLPTNYGEAITLRLLGLDKDYLLEIENIGIEPEELKIVKKDLGKAKGMVLLTGATGSGKTTTLYAFLSYRKTAEIKIMTLEDPIEYRLDGITQIQINENEGLTFARALRGVLRQDPDVIMVGEIRDPETAEITIRAATTGHIVLSTLHAGSATEIITQLSNMGADPQNLSDVLNLLINQKLVRRLCEKCRAPYPTPPDLLLKMREVSQNKFPLPDNLTLYHPQGCEACDNIGYRGQVGIFEIMHISKEITRLIASRAAPEEIYNQAIKEGMFTLVQDGLRKVIRGETTLEELKRVN